MSAVCAWWPATVIQNFDNKVRVAVVNGVGAVPLMVVWCGSCPRRQLHLIYSSSPHGLHACMQLYKVTFDGYGQENILQADKIRPCNPK